MWLIRILLHCNEQARSEYMDAGLVCYKHTDATSLPRVLITSPQCVGKIVKSTCFHMLITLKLFGVFNIAKDDFGLHNELL